MPNPGRYTSAVDHLMTVRYDSDCIVSLVVKPAIYFILQGFGHIELAFFQKVTTSQSFLIIGPQMPMVARIKASRDHPLIVLVLHIDFKLLRAVDIMASSGQNANLLPDYWVTNGAMDVNMNKILLSLLNRSDQKGSALQLTPPELVDLYSYFMKLPQGAILKRMSGAAYSSLIHSIYWANDRYTDQLTVADLAKEADMSLTSYHRHFKAITTLSPLQYLKTVRLMEARRLMLFYGKSAADACQNVGYGSASQFNREYKRFFSMPPHKEISYTIQFNKPVYQPLSLNHRFKPLPINATVI
jgi:AraC-like DNA-binding protein